MPQNTSEDFLSFLKIHKGIIYKVSNSYCKDTEDRKDLIQEIVYQLWKSFSKYDQNHRSTTWIYRVALNVAISFYRKENRRKEIAAPITPNVLNFSIDKDSPDLEDLSFLQQCISTLKELDKALIILYLEEKSHKEIAEIMGISETNVSTKIGRIKNYIKQKFTLLNKKLEDQLNLNKRAMDELTKMKIHSHLASMKPIKLFAILIEMIWVVLGFILWINLLIYTSKGISLFFMVSAGIQLMITAIATILYIYQWILLQQVGVEESVLNTQLKLTALKSSTLLVVQILILQLPFWTTFYLNESMWDVKNMVFLIINAFITFVFTYISWWLFINIRYENKNKKWFKILFDGQEWTPILRSMELHNEMTKFKEGTDQN